MCLFASAPSAVQTTWHRLGDPLERTRMNPTQGELNIDDDDDAEDGSDEAEGGTDAIDLDRKSVV